MESRKLTKEDLDKVRDIEGFPIADDEDIIALSDAPYYTACPNPFVEEFINEKGTPYDEKTDSYHKEPFTTDVSEGKRDPLYMAHTYHTKVPHKAIMRYILHYTKPGDIVFDGFCGSGMTGLACQACGSPDEEFKFKIEQEMGEVEWGTRYAILNDLSPIATFIAKNYNRTYDRMIFKEKANRVLKECREHYGWMYRTKHTDQDDKICFLNDDEGNYGVIDKVVWSDVFICPHCGEELVYWNIAIDHEKGESIKPFKCQKCNASMSKTECKHAIEIVVVNGETFQVAKQVPVHIVYYYRGKTYHKNPDKEDLDLLKKIDSYPIEYWIPTYDIPKGDNTAQPLLIGVSKAHLFYTKRNLIILSYLRKYLTDDIGFLYTSLVERVSKHTIFSIQNFFHGGGGWAARGLPGTLFIPSLGVEINPIENLAEKIKRTAIPDFTRTENTCIQCQSSLDLKTIPDKSVDYIFTDPPFGANLNYSEISFFWEGWIKCFTNNSDEAIINKTQKKTLIDYQNLMINAFKEFYRILKPCRWITVEFHNSQNAVWNAIQEAITHAGFVIADVRTLDKKMGTFKQMTTTAAVKQDLVISAYKPKESFVQIINKQAGSEETAWAFVRQHLENIPVVVVKNDRIEIIAERQAYLLFDRMIAYHIMNGLLVPIDASDFYKGLNEHFLCRDGMYFLPDQVNEYDTARIKTDIEPIQFSFLVTNEKTAISWLYQQLSEEYGGPKTYADIQPKFMQEVKTVDKYEAMPELQVILEENFLQDEKGRWYVPDISKEGDIAKLREKNLMKEFEEYLTSKGKLKKFRSEVIRLGFSKLWKDKNYRAIVDMAERLPEQTVQEDPNILMYYDISLSRV